MIALVLSLFVSVADPGNPPDTTPLNTIGTSGVCQDGAICQSDNNCINQGHPPPCDKFEWPEHMQSRGAVDYLYEYQKTATSVQEYVLYLNAIGVTPLDVDDPMRVLPSVAIDGADPTPLLPHGFPPLLAWDGSEWTALEPDLPWPYASRTAAFRYINWFGLGNPDLGCYDCTGPVCDRTRLIDIASGELGVCAPTIHEQEKATHWDAVAYVWREWPGGFAPLPGPPGVGDANVSATPEIPDGHGRCGSGLESTNAVCSWVSVDAYPQSDSAFGVRGSCGNGYAITETCGELYGLEDCSRAVLRGQHPWLVATDCRLARPQQTTADGINQVGTEIRMVQGIAQGARACANGLDDDGDGLADLLDPGCSGTSDGSERTHLYDCDDGVDNDGDGRTDFDPLTKAEPGDETTPPAGVGDPGCASPASSSEAPQCQDGLDNDGDSKIDYDGGLAAGVGSPGDRDPQCGSPTRYREAAVPICGLGFELALVMAGVGWLARRRRRRPTP